MTLRDAKGPVARRRDNRGELSCEGVVGVQWLVSNGWEQWPLLFNEMAYWKYLCISRKDLNLCHSSAQQGVTLTILYSQYSWGLWCVSRWVFPNRELASFAGCFLCQASRFEFANIICWNPWESRRSVEDNSVNRTYRKRLAYKYWELFAVFTAFCAHVDFIAVIVTSWLVAEAMKLSAKD